MLSERKSVVFFGTTPNIGTTFVAFGTAVRLASLTNLKIGYVCLNLKSSKIHHYLGRKNETNSLDQIRSELKTKSVLPATLQHYMPQVKGAKGQLYTLSGNMQREQAEFYQPADIEHLLEVCREVYDVTVVDVNAYWDNAATLTSLLHTDLRIAVTNGELACFQEDVEKWIRTGCSLLSISPKDMFLFVTQWKWRQERYKLKDIAGETDISLAGTLGYHARLNRFANQGALVEGFQDGMLESAEIDAFLRVIAESFGIQLTEGHPTLKKRMFWLGSKTRKVGHV